MSLGTTFGKALRYGRARVDARIHGAAISLRRGRERRALLEAYPFLGDDELRRDVESRLADAHEAYVRTVSNRVMAVSLEVATTLGIFCRSIRPARVLDLGSGFSSWTVRTMLAPNHESFVMTMDDDAQWLERTRSYLAESNLDNGELSIWDPEALDRGERFDLVFYDLGRMPVRERELPRILRMAQSWGSLVVLDDLHKRGYRRLVRRALDDLPGRALSLAPVTLDDYRRYAVLADFSV